MRIQSIIIGLILVLLNCQQNNSQLNTNKNSTFKKNTKTIRFSSNYKPTVTTFPIIKAIYTEAFRRNGYEFFLDFYPSERSLIEADLGNTDGDANRIFNLDTVNEYPNLIRVEESIWAMKNGVYSLDTSIKINSYNDLKKKNYLIAIQRGTKAIEYKLKETGINKKNIIILTSVYQQLDMIMAKRVDMFILTTEVEELLEKDKKKYGKIKRVGIVGEYDLYSYMHKKHKVLAKKIAQTLRMMKKDGTYYKIIYQVKKNRK